MIRRYGNRCTVRIREGSGKMKPGWLTTNLLPKKPGEMTQGLGSMIKHSCLYSEQANALPCYITILQTLSVHHNVVNEPLPGGCSALPLSTESHCAAEHLLFLFHVLTVLLMKQPISQFSLVLGRL